VIVCAFELCVDFNYVNACDCIAIVVVFLFYVRLCDCDFDL
jgi:hypothetical protein